MAKIKIGAGKEAVENAGKVKDWKPPKPGLYVGVLAGGEEKTANESKNKYVQLRWQPTHEGRDESTPVPDDTGSVWDNVTFDEGTEWKRAQVAIALGGKTKRDGSVELELELDPNVPGTSIGTKVLMKVKSGKNQDGDYRPDIQFLSPFDPDDSGSSAFADDDGDDDPEDNTNPFDDADTGTDDGDDDLWTEEGLRDLEPAALSEEAKAFDLDPSELKVFTGRGKARKVDVDKTITAMVEAILEAQNGDPDADDGSAEDPF